MTKTEIIWILIILMLALLFAIMFLDLLLEKEKKKYEDLMHVHKRTLKDIERKDRMLGAWEKYVPFLEAHGAFELKDLPMTVEWSPTGQPCDGCGDGWAGIDGDDVFHTCMETCEKLAAWNEQQKKED